MVQHAASCRLIKFLLLPDLREGWFCWLFLEQASGEHACTFLSRELKPCLGSGGNVLLRRANRGIVKLLMRMVMLHGGQEAHPSRCRVWDSDGEVDDRTVSYNKDFYAHA